MEQNKKFHTFVDVYVRPEVLAFSNVDRFAQLEGQLDPAGDLLGVGPLKTVLHKDGVGDAPNRGWKDDPGFHIA